MCGTLHLQSHKKLVYLLLSSRFSRMKNISVAAQCYKSGDLGGWKHMTA